VKERVRKYREANIEKVREYDRNRPNHEKRREINARRNRNKYHSDPAFKQRSLKRRAAWIVKNNVKRQAHIQTGNRIKDGSLIKQPCEVCGCLEVEAHHEDYSAPMDVRWLCRKHHAARHREINEAIRSGEDWSHKGF
jgi:hypothetical protein